MANSLFAASAADLTIERIRALAARPDQVESLTLEFKPEYSSSLVKTIAAMANTYGGLIMVGVADKVESGSERVVACQPGDAAEAARTGGPSRNGPRRHGDELIRGARPSCGNWRRGDTGPRPGG
ncbi:helix-turn-helix domain-containing protein [Streptomyces sp. R33]|uniref:Helix-turn-helix domain-containing protein n=1 Tax=Streptomyces sp. R33 TaxID=3238629 RepID=A0AB39YGI4_9ACTN